MKSILLIFALLNLSIFLTACGHMHVVENPTLTAEGVQVRIGSKEVTEGDSVDVFRQICQRKRTIMKLPATESCSSVKLTTAKVIKVLGKERAVIAPPQGFIVESDMFVEKSE